MEVHPAEGIYILIQQTRHPDQHLDSILWNSKSEKK